MRTSLVVGLLVALCVVIGVGTAAADSRVNYVDGSVSQVFNLGGGQHAFVFFDNPGDGDIFIHPVNFSADLLSVSLNNFNAFAIWLDFEGPAGQFLQYGVYTCTSPAGQTCTVSGVRRGTLFL
jgi:hypothetical protein